MSNNINYELETAPVGKLLFKLAFPAVVAQLVNLLYTVVDRIYIGHIKDVGSLALTGVGICLPIVTIINAFVMLIAQGGAPLASIAIGKKDNDRAEEILGNCTCLLVLIGILLSIIFISFGKPILMLFGASKDTIIYAYPYLCWYVAGSVFLMISFGLTLFATSQGFTQYSMISVLIGAVGNILLDPLFIFVFQLGVKGAAIATVISQAASSIFILCFLQSKVSNLHIKKENLKCDIKIIVPIMALGASPFIMQITEAALSLSFNYSLQKYGGDLAVGAMTIASTIMLMFWIPSNGIGQGAQPIISYNYGAGNQKRLKEIVKVFILTSEIFFFTCWLLIELFPSVFISLFNPDPELYKICIWSLRLYLGSLGCFGLQNTAQQFFISTGQAKISIFIAVLRKIILLIPLIFILPNFFENKVFAVFLAEPVSDLISVTVAFSLFSWKFPRILLSMESQKQD